MKFNKIFVSARKAWGNGGNYEKITVGTNIPAYVMYMSAETLKQQVMINQPRNIPPHWHRSIEFSLVYKGEVHLWVNNHKQVIREGEFIFVNGGQVHKLDGPNLAKCEVLLVIISYDFLKKVYPTIENLDFDLQKESNAKQRLYQIYDFFKSFSLTPKLYDEIMVNAYLYEIIYILLNEYQVELTENEKKHKMSQKRQHQILDFIEEHYKEELTLNTMAELCYMSEEHFSRSFRDLFGITFKAYLTNYRLYCSYEDVIASNKRIQDIAFIYGFSNIKSFINAFKESYHATPYQYRKKNIKKRQ